MPATQTIDLDAIKTAPLERKPYSYLMNSNFLKKEQVDTLRREFPDIQKPGFLTVDDVEIKGTFKQLIDELEGPELTAALSERFGVDLSPYPRLTTIRKVSQLKDGRIHTDGPSKVLTLLVYMNDEWQDDGAGRLRVLNGPDDFDDMVTEVPPTMGTVFAFLRADNSWHGHKPFAGERRVVQVAWIKDAEELERKKNRNTVAKFFKGIFGR
jgi:Rps23 Pro-64 3,4-dihydroxylase Tpa1-like proline 4-hydroxylase